MDQIQETISHRLRPRLSKYWGLQTLNNDKFELLFNTMNKKLLLLMYSFVFCRVFIVLVDFRLHCITTVTPFISQAGHCDLARILDESHQKPFYFAEIWICCNVFSSSPRRKPPLPLCAIGWKKASFFPFQIEPFVLYFIHGSNMTLTLWEIACPGTLELYFPLQTLVTAFQIWSGWLCLIVVITYLDTRSWGKQHN